VSKYSVTLPALGEAIDQGTLVAWHVAEGDVVVEGQPLYEVATDKVDSEIPSPVSGILVRHVVAEGAHVVVGDTVGVIEADVHAVAETAPRPVESSAATSTIPHPPISPLIPPRAASPGVVSTTAPLPPLPGETAMRVGVGPHEGKDFEAFSRVRGATAKMMAASAATIPHVLSVVEVDYSRVANARQSWVGPGRAPTSLAFVTKAVAVALREFPRLNASVAEGGLLLHERIDIAIAVDTPDGLVAPVLRDVGLLSLEGVAAGIRYLAERARAGALTAGELSGATFTISNNGSAGSVLTTPLITPPQVAVISTDKVVDRVVVVDTPDGGTGMAIRPIGNLSMSWDHRALDGAQAAGFLERVRHLVEEE